MKEKTNGDARHIKNTLKTTAKKYPCHIFALTTIRIVTMTYLYLLKILSV